MLGQDERRSQTKIRMIAAVCGVVAARANEFDLLTVTRVKLCKQDSASVIRPGDEASSVLGVLSCAS